MSEEHANIVRDILMNIYDFQKVVGKLWRFKDINLCEQDIKYLKEFENRITVTKQIIERSANEQFTN